MFGKVKIRTYTRFVNGEFVTFTQTKANSLNNVMKFHRVGLNYGWSLADPPPRYSLAKELQRKITLE